MSGKALQDLKWKAAAASAAPKAAKQALGVRTPGARAQQETEAGGCRRHAPRCTWHPGDAVVVANESPAHVGAWR